MRGAGLTEKSLTTVRMKIFLFTVSMRIAPLLAQTSGSLAEGASKAMGIVMLIGFIFGTICVIGGGFSIRRGDADDRVGRLLDLGVRHLFDANVTLTVPGHCFHAEPPIVVDW